MTWETFYLICFVVGFAFAAIGFLGGTLHWPFGHHLPDFFSHGAAGAHVPADHVPLAPGSRASSISPFNFACLMAFLAWFGGMGYLLTARGQLPRLAILLAATAAGCAGAAIVFLFLAKVLLKRERFLDAADFDMVGVLARVTVPIRAGGTGEIVYSQAGTRRSAGARSDSGGAVLRGSEVVVTRYERGIAYVRLWEELTGDTTTRAEESTDGNEKEKKE